MLILMILLIALLMLLAYASLTPEEGHHYLESEDHLNYIRDELKYQFDEYDD